jgi:low affinity Fe/Cu permease
MLSVKFARSMFYSRLLIWPVVEVSLPTAFVVRRLLVFVWVVMGATLLFEVMNQTKQFKY